MQGSELIPLSKFTSDPLSPGLWALQVAVQGTTIARWYSLCDEPIGCVCVCVCANNSSISPYLSFPSVPLWYRSNEKEKKVEPTDFPPPLTTLTFRLTFLVLDFSSLPNFMPLPSLAKFYPLESLCLSSSKCSDSSCTSKVTSCPNLPSCQTQPWSSLYPDLKSQFPPSSIT